MGASESHHTPKPYQSNLCSTGHKTLLSLSYAGHCKQKQSLLAQQQRRQQWPSESPHKSKKGKGRAKQRQKYKSRYAFVSNLPSVNVDRDDHWYWQEQMDNMSRKQIPRLFGGGGAYRKSKKCK
jgi:hypothetical protein